MLRYNPVKMPSVSTSLVFSEEGVVEHILREDIFLIPFPSFETRRSVIDVIIVVTVI
jgi:hypothetical protein